MDIRSLSQLLPAQDLPEFIRFSPDAAGARRWVEALPRANLGDVTRALFQAFTELNRFQLPPRQRLSILEVLRPLLEGVQGGLARHYLNQPIVLPAQAAQVAQLVETLNREVAQNYARIVADADSRDETSLAAVGIDRAGAALNANLLLGCQLYREPAEHTWLILHALYQRLRDTGLDQRSIRVGDTTFDPGSQYRRALLLGSARPSQLRQRDLEVIFPLLLDWAEYVRLSPQRNDSALWAVAPGRDTGPVLSERTDFDTGWALDTRAVADHIAEQPGNLSPSLVQHLQSAWQTPASRSFVRLESKDELYIALGLTATHHFVADEEDFQVLVSGLADPWSQEADNPFLRGKTTSRATESDVWSSAYKTGTPPSAAIETIDYNIRRHHKQQSDSRGRYATHRVQSLNSSPTGYCLQWAPDAKVSLRSGELVGLRPSDQSHWTIAAVRWVQLRREGPSIGVQLLGPTAVPYAARPTASHGTDGDFQRVLMLPEIAAIGQPTTLITPHLPFREGQRVELTQHGQKSAIKLTRLVASTGAFSQFEFRRLSTGGAARPTDDRDGFDALWDQL